jgi:hypothetical protein
MEGGADQTGIDQQFAHRVDAHVLDASDCPHGRILAEHREDFGALGEGQLEHAPSI